MTIDLNLGLVRLEQDCRKAGEIAGQTVSKIASAVGSAVGTIVGVGTVAATSAVGLAVLADKQIKVVASLKDLSDQSGIAAVELARLQVAAATSDTSLDRVASLAAKLQATLSITHDTTSRTGGAIKALGLSLETLRSQSPDEQLASISKALAGFADGGGKSAVAIALLGREGAKALPFLNDLAEVGKTTARLTQAQIEAADSYAKAQAKTRAELQQLVQVAAVEALPAIVAFEGALKDTAAAIVGVDVSTQKLSGSTVVADFAKSTAQSLAFVIDAGEGVARVLEVAGKSIGAYGAITNALLHGQLKEAKAIGAEARADLDATLQRPLFSSRLDARLNAPVSTKVEDSRPALNFTLPDQKKLAAAQREAAQVLKQQLDADLKFVKDRLTEEKDAIGNAQAELQALYSASELSVAEFYDRKAAAVAAGVQKELNAITDEQARLEVELERTSDPSDRVKLSSQIAEAAERAARIERQAAADSKVAAIERGTVLRNLADQAAEYRAQLQQLEGDELGAARARAALSVQQAQKLTIASGGLVSADDVRRFADLTARANEFADAQRRIAQASAEASRAEEAYLLRASRGGANQVDQDKAVYQIRAAALVQLGELTERARALAEASSDPKVRQSADDLALAYAKAADQVDPALNRLRAGADELAGSFRNVFDTIFSGSATGADALKSLRTAVVGTLTKTYISDPLQTALKSGLQSVVNGDNPIGRLLRSGTPTAAATASDRGSDAASALDALKDKVGGLLGAQTTQMAAVQSSSSALVELSAAAQAASVGLGLIASKTGTGFGSFVPGVGTSGYTGVTAGMDFSGVGYPLAEGTDRVPYDGFLARLHKDERVTPAKFNPAVNGGWSAGASSGPDEIHIHNDGSLPPMQVAETQTTNGSDGRKVKKLVVTAVADDMRRGGPASKAVQQQYGLERQLVRRA